MVFKYLSGQEIRKGDHVRFHEQPGHVEFVAVDAGDPELGWYVQEFGGGVMILDSVAGCTFVAADDLSDCEDLHFVGRAASP